MRNLPAVTEILPESRAISAPSACDLKNWLSLANSEDLYALYLEEISNKTGYRFYDLLFSLYYEDKTARRFRDGIRRNFRELINGTVSIIDIKTLSLA